mmetsp:Transcript_13167/g.18019  ORF Transcript_13167/g.18019 Transcript_13167/m.18019 type:complete len:81 (+) Transcript_13167:672-914(+)
MSEGLFLTLLVLGSKAVLRYSTLTARGYMKNTINAMPMAIKRMKQLQQANARLDTILLRPDESCLLQQDIILKRQQPSSR